MSLILDALKKSERTRQQSLTAQLGSGEVPSGVSRLPVPWVTLIGLILAANALLLFFFWPRPAPSPLPAAVVHAPAPPEAYRPSVRPLAQETDDLVASPAQLQSGTAGPINAAPYAPPRVSQVSLPAALPSGIDGLPEDVRQSLPALHLDVHGYAGNPKDRFVVINLKQYHIGDSVADGVLLKDIVPQGAVLEYRGNVFLLPAS